MARIYKIRQAVQSPKNKLNILVTVDVLEDGQPVIEPTTGAPLVLELVGDNIGDNIAHACAVQEQALAIRKQTEAKQADQFAKLNAIIAAGGIITPEALKQPTAAELAYDEAYRKLMPLQIEVDAGIIEKTDPAYVAAQLAAKQAKAALVDEQAQVEPKAK